MKNYDQSVEINHKYGIANMGSNKKLSPTSLNFFLRERKLNISFNFISQSYFKVHCFIIKT